MRPRTDAVVRSDLEVVMRWFQRQMQVPRFRASFLRMDRAIKAARRRARRAKRQCVAAVAFDRRGRLLLIRHRTRGTEIPGGKVERGETHVAAVVREVREETGLRVLGVEGRLGAVEGHDYVCTLYLVRVAGRVRAGDDAIAAYWGWPTEVIRRHVDWPFIQRAEARAALMYKRAWR